MSAKIIHQCPGCERGYESREQARNCGCPDRTIEKWECPACGSWWEPKWRTACCGRDRDGQLLSAIQQIVARFSEFVIFLDRAHAERVPLEILASEAHE